MKLKCYKCKNYKKHDSNFGYCKKYDCQARGTDDCEVIREIAPSWEWKMES